MKVLYLAREFTPDHANGVATRAYNTVLSLSHTGAEVHVICDPTFSRSPPERSKITVHFCREIPFDFGPFGFSLLSLEGIFRCVQECGPPDVIHGQGFGTSGALLVRRTGAFSETKTFLTLDDIFTLDRNRIAQMPLSLLQRLRTLAYMGLTNSIDREAVKASDRIITVSNFAKDEIIREFSIEESRVAVIRNGVDAQVFCPANRSDKIQEELNCTDGNLVLTVTHLGYRKGVDLLLRAFKYVSQYNHNVRLAIVGSGGDARYLKELASELEIAGNTYFLGTVTFDRLLKLYATADIFILPSRYESQPISLLEAMSSGVPVVAFDISDFSDYVVDEKTGLLVRPFSVTALAEAIVHLIDNASLRREMSAEARSLVEAHFTWEAVARSHLRVYDSY